MTTFIAVATMPHYDDIINDTGVIIKPTAIRVTDVSRAVTFPDRRFVDKTFPRRLCPWLVDYFPYKMFPGQSLSRTDVSRTICRNNFEYFGMFM